MPKKDWIYRFTCNIVFEQGDTFLVADINGGGGQSPALWVLLVDTLVKSSWSCPWANVSRSTENRLINGNMKWEIWSHPLEQSTIVVLWNRPSGRYIMSVGTYFPSLHQSVTDCS
jgi:hypothetical protein